MKSTAKKGEESIEQILRDTKFDADNNLDQARKLLTAKTKENIEFSLIRPIDTQIDQVLGSYIHKEVAEFIGSSGSFLILQHNGKGRNILI